jgi:hypothetical protein
MRSPLVKDIPLGWWLVMGAGLLSLAVSAGGCGLFPNGPDTAGEAMLTPVHESWGYDMEDFTVRFAREARSRENWDRARKSARHTRRWLDRRADRFTDVVLDILAGPPEDYKEMEPPDEILLPQYTQEP